MRAFILLAGIAVSLTACANNDQKDNTQNIDENLTAENIVSNDVTAIDAVTAADANMAADVNYTDVLGNELGNAPGNSATPDKKPAKRPPTPRPSPKPVTSSPADPASNSD